MVPLLATVCLQRLALFSYHFTFETDYNYPRVHGHSLDYGFLEERVCLISKTLHPDYIIYPSICWTHSSVLAWRIPGTGEPAVCGVAESQTWLKRFSSSSSSSICWIVNKWTNKWIKTLQPFILTLLRRCQRSSWSSSAGDKALDFATSEKLSIIGIWECVNTLPTPSPVPLPLAHYLGLDRAFSERCLAQERAAEAHPVRREPKLSGLALPSHPVKRASPWELLLQLWGWENRHGVRSGSHDGKVRPAH